MTLKQWQQKNKLTDQQAADNIEIARTTYSLIRDSRSKKTTIGNVMKIQAYTGLEINEIIDDVDDLVELINRSRALRIYKK